jgi:hypothetical protein
MKLSARINKLESMHGKARCPFVVVSPQPGESESQALRRALESHGLRDESEAELVVYITKFGSRFTGGLKNTGKDQGNG